ncbi:MAG TPA: thioredoxin-disulfide reductase [Candidatus Limnocylindrales bacterium]|nr:thioredoxin-disulfide reductase [Candidatus Limnocylindrales bacterium]
MNEKQPYDMIILGGGPAGITAAIYAVRAGLSTVILENMSLGGEIVSTERLDNYPAFPDGITGAEFGQLLQKQLENLNITVIAAGVEKVFLNEEIKKIVSTESELCGRTVLIATGTEPNLLGVEGEVRLRGRGVSYCATCDAAFFRGKKIAVIGGGNAALEETIFLSRFTDRISLLHRRDQFRGVKELQDKVLALPNIEVLWNTTVRHIEGENKVTGLNIMQNGVERMLQVDGVFIYAGRKPHAAFLEEISIEQDENGFIITNEKMETSLPGVYAAGDIRHKFLRQVITAAADGAIAATAAAQYLYSY